MTLVADPLLSMLWACTIWRSSARPTPTLHVKEAVDVITDAIKPEPSNVRQYPDR